MIPGVPGKYGDSGKNSPGRIGCRVKDIYCPAGDEPLVHFIGDPVEDKNRERYDKADIAEALPPVDPAKPPVKEDAKNAVHTGVNQLVVD